MNIDYCDGIPFLDPVGGNLVSTQLFVGVLGASFDTYAEASLSQDLPNWLSSHVRMYEFFNSVSEIDEWMDRENKRTNRLLQKAHFRQKKATLEAVDFGKGRGVKKAQILELAQFKWIPNKQNITFTGRFTPTRGRHPSESVVGKPGISSLENGLL